MKKNVIFGFVIAFLLIYGMSYTDTEATSPAPRINLPEAEFHSVFPEFTRYTSTTPSPLIQKIPKSTPAPKLKIVGWIYDRNVSWYGPGFYGKRTACGLAYTKTILGVAHKTLPCGTKVAFKYGNLSIVVPVIDRGPYVTGRQWDLSGALCTYLHHCFTGPLYYKILR